MAAFDTTPLLGTRYLRPEDYADPGLRLVGREVSALYRGEMGGVLHPMWARRPDDVAIHWSRDWEYPWALLNYLAWRRAHPGASVRLVDLGCGGSPLPVYLAEQSSTTLMLALDWADVVQPTAETSTLRRYGKRVVFPAAFTFCRADLLKTLPLRSASVDGVFSISVLEDYPDDWERVLMEIERVLRPGGFALITVDLGRSGTRVDAIAEATWRLFDCGAPGDLLFLVNRLAPPSPAPVETLPGAYHVLGLSFVKRAQREQETATS